MTFGEKREDTMTGILYTASFIALLVTSSLSIRHYYYSSREEWERDGSPIGPLWAPPNQRDELWIGMASKSSRAGSRWLFYLLFITPPVFRDDDRRMPRIILLSYRASSLLGVIFLVRLWTTG